MFFRTESSTAIVCVHPLKLRIRVFEFTWDRVLNQSRHVTIGIHFAIPCNLPFDWRILSLDTRLIDRSIFGIEEDNINRIEITNFSNEIVFIKNPNVDYLNKICKKDIIHF